MSCKLIIPNTFIMCGEDDFNYCSDACMKKGLIKMLNRLALENNEIEKLKLKNNILKILIFLFKESEK